MEQAIIKITGNVQGVSYRANAKREALSLNLKGYAKNLPDGSVEVFLQGEKEQIEKFVVWAKKGPTNAQVENVIINWLKPTPQNSSEDFEIF